MKIGGRQHSQTIFSKGFTIVELLIVVVVIAILAAITIVSYNGITRSARVSAAAEGIRQVEKALKMWAMDEGYTTWPPDNNGSGGIFLTTLIANNPSLQKYLQTTPSVQGVASDEWFYDNDGDTKPAGCGYAYNGVNLTLRYVEDTSFAQQIDTKMDDGNLNCGNLRYENNILFYSISFGQATNL